jgi:hypothetical protein
MTDPGAPTQPAEDGGHPPREAVTQPSSETVVQTSGEPAAGAAPEVDIGGWVKAGWEMFAKNIGPAIGIPLVVLVPVIVFVLFGYFGVIILAIMSDQHKSGAGLLAMGLLGSLLGLALLVLALVMSALSAGVCACFLDGLRTGKLTTARLGAGFRNWWACTWVAWVLGLAMLLCLPFVIILVGLPALYAIHTLTWLALFRIVDQGRGGMEALAFAWNAMRGRLWMMLLFTFLVVTLMTAGVSTMYVGVLVTVPIGVAALAAGYEAMSKRARGEAS